MVCQPPSRSCQAGQVPRPPVKALSQWHLALAAGAISGVVTSPNGRVLVLKGDTYKEKVSRTRFTEDEDGNVLESRILTDRFVPVIQAWDMTPGPQTPGQVLTITSAPAAGYPGEAAQLRQALGEPYDGRQEFFILGRVRMRMGLHWRLACGTRCAASGRRLACCTDCGRVLEDEEGNSLTLEDFQREERRRQCPKYKASLWTLMRPGKAAGGDRRSVILKSMCRIPTIGPIGAEKLVADFGEEFLATMLG